MGSQGEIGGGWWVFVITILVERGRTCSSLNASDCREAQSSGFYRLLLMLFVLLLLSIVTMLARWAAPGGTAWGRLEDSKTIPGPRGWPVIGSLLCMKNLAHRRLAELASQFGARRLMAFSLGNNRAIICSHPETARELLNSSFFADRPLKLSAKLLLFDRAIGFAPYGPYWRNLRRIAATHLFSPKRIAAQEICRQIEISSMLKSIQADAEFSGAVQIRKYLQVASLNNIMRSVFGRRFGPGSVDAETLQEIVREGYELLGALNWADSLPFLRFFDPQGIQQRCAALVPRVRAFVQKIIDEHREGSQHEPDFVSVLLSLKGEDQLQDTDMIAVLWEMVFRGTDTIAILTEWLIAEVVLHPLVQRRLHAELDGVVGTARVVSENDICKMPFLQAVIKETLRMHPPGPLLSWARVATHDTTVDGHGIPAGTTAMVNMWSITHNPSIWAEPDEFKPERFLTQEGGIDIDIRGNDLRLAPFGAGRRVCPGRALGQATVQLWVARLLHHFQWMEVPSHPVKLDEILKLSCEMKTALVVGPMRRNCLAF